MRSIFGRINIDLSPVNANFFNESINKLLVLADNKKEIITESNATLAQITFQPNTITSQNDSKLVLISDSSIYNKQGLARDLNISNDDITDDLIILKAYQTWQEKCVEYFIGDFAFAIWNKETRELFCARDHLGVKPFHYYFDNKSFVFSSDIAAILAQHDLNFTLEEQQVADSLSIIKSDKHRTTYNEIKNLPNAHYLTLKDNQLEIKQYWNLKPKKNIQKRDTEIIDEFRNLLTEAVKCRTEEQEEIGAELSGGIDSSTVAAIASQFAEIKTFSHILPDTKLGKIFPHKDERQFVNLLTDYCQISGRNFVTSEESLLNTLKGHIEYYQSLAQQNFGIFSDQLYKKAQQEKVAVLLSGFGGDEVVTSQSSGYLNELVKNSEWNELKTDLKNQYPKKQKYTKVLFKLYLKSKLQGIYTLLSLLKFQKPWWHAKYNNLALNPDYEKKQGVKTRYFDYYKKIARDTLQEKNIERITHPHVSQRLEYCSLIARKFGIEYRYPLLDIRLIEFYLSVPPRLKARNGIGRYIMRRAIEGIVPEKIQWRSDKSGATIPTVFMRMINDKEEIQQLIEQAKTNEQVKTYIDLEKYEQWFHKLCNRTKDDKFVNPGAFYTYLKLIIFIERNPNLFK